MRRFMASMTGNRDYFLGNARYYVDPQNGKRYAIYVDRVIPTYIFYVVQGLVFNAAFAEITAGLRVMLGAARRLMGVVDNVIINSVARGRNLSLPLSEMVGSRFSNTFINSLYTDLRGLSTNIINRVMQFTNIYSRNVVNEIVERITQNDSRFIGLVRDY